MAKRKKQLYIVRVAAERIVALDDNFTGMPSQFTTAGPILYKGTSLAEAKKVQAANPGTSIGVDRSTGITLKSFTSGAVDRVKSTLKSPLPLFLAAPVAAYAATSYFGASAAATASAGSTAGAIGSAAGSDVLVYGGLSGEGIAAGLGSTTGGSFAIGEAASGVSLIDSVIGKVKDFAKKTGENFVGTLLGSPNDVTGTNPYSPIFGNSAADFAASPLDLGFGNGPTKESPVSSKPWIIYIAIGIVLMILLTFLARK